MIRHEDDADAFSIKARQAEQILSNISAFIVIGFWTDFPPEGSLLAELGFASAARRP
jgi:hypothetical protein